MADFHIKQDDLMPELTATLTDADDDVVDVTNATIRFHMRPKGSLTPKVDAAATKVDEANGQVKYTWIAGDTDTPGDFLGEFEITWTSGSKPQRVPNEGYITIQIDAKIA